MEKAIFIFQVTTKRGRIYGHEWFDYKYGWSHSRTPSLKPKKIFGGVIRDYWKNEILIRKQLK